MTAKHLKLIAEIFPNATFETLDGLYVYDKKGPLVCVYINEGFSLVMEYPGIEKVKKRLEEYGFDAWWKEIMDEAEFEKLTEAIYGEPK